MVFLWHHLVGSISRYPWRHAATLQVPADVAHAPGTNRSGQHRVVYTERTRGRGAVARGWTLKGLLGHSLKWRFNGATPMAGWLWMVYEFYITLKSDLNGCFRGTHILGNLQILWWTVGDWPYMIIRQKARVFCILLSPMAHQYSCFWWTESG